VKRGNQALLHEQISSPRAAIVTARFVISWTIGSGSGANAALPEPAGFPLMLMAAVLSLNLRHSRIGIANQ
jgi:hypothetical protein